MGQSYGPRRIFLPAGPLLIFVQYGHILGKTLCSGPTRSAGLAGKPMGAQAYLIGTICGAHEAF
jgi:hypothetical protein